MHTGKYKVKITCIFLEMLVDYLHLQLLELSMICLLQVHIMSEFCQWLKDSPEILHRLTAIS